MTTKQAFFKKQLTIFDKHNIVYYSIVINLDWNESEKKYKKNPLYVPKYSNITLTKKFMKQSNGTIVPTGKNYNGLIGSTWTIRTTL